jgi:hypothetical protein
MSSVAIDELRVKWVSSLAANMNEGEVVVGWVDVIQQVEGDTTCRLLVKYARDGRRGAVSRLGCEK